MYRIYAVAVGPGFGPAGLRGGRLRANLDLGAVPVVVRQTNGSYRLGHHNDGPPMLLPARPSPQRWPIDAAGSASMSHRCCCSPGGNRNDGPRVRFRGSEFWSTPRRGPDGTGPPALPASASTGIPGIPGIQGSSPPRPLTPETHPWATDAVRANSRSGKMEPATGILHLDHTHAAATLATRTTSPADHTSP